MQKDNDLYGMKAILFLQIDLAGHSRWFCNAESWPEAFEARVQFAEKVTKKLEEYDFYLLFWQGDGGIFRHDVASESTKNYDFAILAADVAFHIFLEWKNEKTDRQNLQLRVSIHHGWPVYTHKYPGYWISDDLNIFAKNEREIALPGTIAITDKVYHNLYASNIRNRFPESSKKEFIIGGGLDRSSLIKWIYYDKTRKAPKYPGITSLVAYLNTLSKKIGLEVDKTIGPSSEIRTIFGEAIVLSGLSSPSDNLQIYLKKVNQFNSYDFKRDELKAFKELSTNLKNDSLNYGFEDKKKVSPQRIIFPLSDHPYMTIEWHVEYWSRSRAFQKMLEEDHSKDSMWSRLAKKAADTQVKGINYPSILCMHILIRPITTKKDEKIVLLCQRNQRGPKGFFHEGKWSCSIEEQINPGETIEMCVKRGISEEILGAQASKHLDVKIVAAFLERILLNLSLLAVVDIPITYEEIVEHWRREAIDKYEHRQLLALPLKEEFILDCIKSNEITKKSRNACHVIDNNVFQDTKKWDLHPTSSIRLATALWFENHDI